MSKLETKQIDSLTVTGGRLDIPLVVVKKGEKLMGFVPALHIESVWGEIGEEDSIISVLREKAKDKVREMVTKGEPFPFFPDSASVTFDFSPIKMEHLIAHIGKGGAK